MITFSLSSVPEAFPLETRGTVQPHSPIMPCPETLK